MVSLCAIQLEISEDSEQLLSDDINFNCGRSIEDLFENLTMSTQPSKPVRSQSLRERTKGNRKMSDITVQTYTDFEAGATASSKSSKGILHTFCFKEYFKVLKVKVYFMAKLKNDSASEAY